MSDMFDTQSFGTIIALLTLVFSPILLVLTWLWAKTTGNTNALTKVKSMLPKFITNAQLQECKIELRAEVYQRLEDIVQPVRESTRRIEHSVGRLHQRLDDDMIDRLKDAKGKKE